MAINDHRRIELKGNCAESSESINATTCGARMGESSSISLQVQFALFDCGSPFINERITESTSRNHIDPFTVTTPFAQFYTLSQMTNEASRPFGCYDTTKQRSSRD